MILFNLVLIAFMFTMGLFFSYLAIVEKDLLKSVIYSAVQSISFAIGFAILLAPDILLVYLAVGIGIYPILILYTISKTERFEKR